MTAVAAPTPRSRFLSHIRAAVLEDLEPEIVLAQKVAVLQACGFRRTEIACKLDAETPAALRLAEQRVKKAAERLDAGD